MLEKIIISLITLIAGTTLRHNYPQILKRIKILIREIFSRGYFVFITKKEKEIIDYLLDSKNKIYFSKQDEQFYINLRQHRNYYNGEFAGFLGDILSREYQNVYKMFIKD